MAEASGYCTQCGAQLQPLAQFCSVCGRAVRYALPPDRALPPPPLPPPSPLGQRYYAPPPEQDGTFTTVFPYKNGRALWAYYLGCFSFIFPPLALGAIIMGILGFNAYRQEPRLKGAAHAWIGVIAGVIAIVLWALLIFSWTSAFNPSD